jgi:hypothetical protein
MRGRYPAGLEECIEELEGSVEDKQRLRTILTTLFGAVRLFESCAALDVGETRFRQLRRLALQGALDGIKAKPPGRPGKASTLAGERLGELERLLAEKELELQQALVREEVALILPRLAAEPGKKTLRPSVRLRKRKPR